MIKLCLTAKDAEDAEKFFDKNESKIKTITAEGTEGKNMSIAEDPS